MEVKAQLIELQDKYLQKRINQHIIEMEKVKEAYKVQLQLLPLVVDILPFAKPLKEVESILDWAGLDCDPNNEFDIQIRDAIWNIRLLWEWKDHFFYQWELDLRLGRTIGDEHQYYGRIRSREDDERLGRMSHYFKEYQKYYHERELIDSQVYNCLDQYNLPKDLIGLVRQYQITLFPFSETVHSEYYGWPK